MEHPDIDAGSLDRTVIEAVLIGWSGTLTEPVEEDADPIEAARSTPDRPAMHALLVDLAEGDVLVVLTTNNDEEAQDALAARYLDTGLMSAIVNSSLVGVCQPDPEFFAICIDFCDVAPQQILLVDHRIENLAAAASLGISGVLVDDDVMAAAATVRSLVLETRP